MRKLFLPLLLLIFGHTGFCAEIAYPPVLKDMPVSQQQYFKSLYDNFSTLKITTTAPDGNIRANKGVVIIYNNSGSYEQWVNVDGATDWENVSGISGNLDMSNNRIINLATPVNGTDGANKDYVDDNTYTLPDLYRTVLYWSSVDVYEANNFGFQVTTSGLANPAVEDPNYAYFNTDQTSYDTFLWFKFIKSEVVDTIKIYARVASSQGSANTVTVNVDIGGQSNTVTRQSATLGWTTTSEIDVSGLTDGTTYDGIVQAKESAGSEVAKCSAVMLIGY